MLSVTVQPAHSHLMPDRDLTFLLPLLNHLQEPVISLDSHGLLLTINPAALALTGAAPDATGRQHLWDLASPEEQTALRHRLLDRSQPALPTFIEFRPAHPTGSPPLLRWSLYRCTVPDTGRVLTLLTTDPRPTSEQRREFLSHAGHELRNPLSSILAFAEALQEGVHGPLNTDQVASLHAIRENVQRQLELINQFVELGHLEGGNATLTPAPVPLDTILQNALTSVRELAQGRSSQISTHISPPQAIIDADARRVIQIVSEVLAIGVISSPTGAELRLDLAAPPAPGAVLRLTLVGGPPNHGFAFTGSPNGMDATSSKALARVHKLRPIGHALLVALVKLHQGTFSYQATEDGSMGMLITLPLSPQVENSQGQPYTPPQPDEPVGWPTPEQDTTVAPLVLLADDQPALSSITRDYLESIGLRVEVAYDGQEAVTKTLALQPDLIMMDVQMPVMDGLEAIRQIRQSSVPRIAQVPIISLSGLAIAGDMEKCISAGATAYLAKPFGVQQLQRAIREFIALP